MNSHLYIQYTCVRMHHTQSRRICRGWIAQLSNRVLYDCRHRRNVVMFVVALFYHVTALAQNHLNGNIQITKKRLT